MTKDFKVPLSDEDKEALHLAAEGAGRSMRKQAQALIREGLRDGLIALVAKTDA